MIYTLVERQGYPNWTAVYTNSDRSAVVSERVDLIRDGAQAKDLRIIRTNAPFKALIEAAIARLDP